MKRRRPLFGSVVVLAALGLFALTFTLRAQTHAPPQDLRELHELAVYATVRIETPHGIGTGWLLAQSGRPVVVTAKHVVEGIPMRRPVQVSFYQGTGEHAVSVAATIMARSDTIDLAVLGLQADPPSSARPIAMRVATTVVRGERVVLGGNPLNGHGDVLPFQTTEGVVTGHASGPHYARCGSGRNCVVVDAASLGGSSGGPAFNIQGQLVGMLWGGPQVRGEVQTSVGGRTRTGESVGGVGLGRADAQNPTLAYLIHTRTLAHELRLRER